MGTVKPNGRGKIPIALLIQALDLFVRLIFYDWAYLDELRIRFIRMT